MRINIIYEINHREYLNCILLQRELVRRGYKTFLLNKTEDIVLSREPSITILPNSYRTKDVKHYQYMFNTRDGLIIIYPNEQISNPAFPLPKYFENTDTNLAKKYPHLCWGEKYYSFIESLGFDMTFSQIVGSVQLDLCRKYFSDLFIKRDELATRYSLPNDRKWILFISAFILDDDAYFAERCKDGSNDIRVLEARRDIERKTSDIVLEWFDKFLNNHKDYVIIYRKHPVETLSKKIIDFQRMHQDNFYCIPDYSIKEWIMKCDRLVTWNSTSLAECYVAGKNLHVVRPVPFTEEAKKKEYAIYQNYRKITSYEQFETDILNDVCAYDDVFKAELKAHYDIELRPSFIRVADAIENIYSQCNSMPMEHNFAFNRWRYLLRKFMPLKVFIKKIYQYFFLITGISLARQDEKKFAVYEWTTSAVNKSKTKELSKQIDEILERIHEELK